MKKVMISQPMAGKTDEEILAVKKAATEHLEKEGYEVVNTFFPDEDERLKAIKGSDNIQIPIYLLAKSIEAMSTCDAVYFCKGWDTTRGCLVEHKIATDYGLVVLYE